MICSKDFDPRPYFSTPFPLCCFQFFLGNIPATGCLLMWRRDRAHFIDRLRRTDESIQSGIVRIWESDEILARFYPPPPPPTCHQTQPQSESHTTTKKEVRNLI